MAYLKQLWHHFGPGWLAYRAWYAFWLRSGLAQRRLPVERWETRPFPNFLKNSSLAEPEAYLKYRQESAPSFFFSPNQREAYQPLFFRWDKKQSPENLAQKLKQGYLQYFGHETVHVGFPPKWHENPFTHQTIPNDIHWSRIHDFAYGDIKIIWEASRFGFVFPLVRAYWRSGNEEYAEMFWQAVMDWRRMNPPQLGANWKCGQETSLRVMAWVFGLYGFLFSPTTTPNRVMALAHMIAVSGERIEKNLRYAVSQRNNHGISEGLGLWTIGVLFPELKRAQVWEQKGRKVLETLGLELIAPDGSFAQHSVNYHRLMLHDYLWCLRLAQIQERPFSSKLHNRVKKAGEWLTGLVVGKGGEVPFYGQIDGAQILPLNNCDFRDFRPVVQAVHYLFAGYRCLAGGEWDEDLLWLFGPESLEKEIDKLCLSDFVAPEGGYYLLRGENSAAFVRCGQFRERPSQADLLHTDIWWQGEPIAFDAGTYSYNATPPWNNPFADSRYHNCVTVDERPQMERRGKFLWLPWEKGIVERYISNSNQLLTYWQGRIDGYERLPDPVSYQRGIVYLGDDTWLVFDRLQAAMSHDFRLHWLLADWPVEENGHQKFQLKLPQGNYYIYWGEQSQEIGTKRTDYVRADENSPRGWYAPYYGCRQPAHSISMTKNGEKVLFWTLFSPFPSSVAYRQNQLLVTQEDKETSFILSGWNDRWIISNVYQQIRGSIKESLLV